MEFVQAYTVTMNNQNVYHWLMKKSVTDEEMNNVVNSNNSTSKEPSNSDNREMPEALKKYMQ